jgi:lipopolysaccharide exporter
LKAKSDFGVALGWTGLSALARGSVQAALLVVAATCFTPAQFGVIAIFNVINGVAATFADSGIASSIINNDTISTRYKSSLHWLSLAVGSTVALVVFALARGLAEMYKGADLVAMIELSAIIHPIVATSVVIRMENERKLKFNDIAKVEIASSVIGAVTGIIAIVSGLGPISVVYGAVAAAIIFAISVQIFLRAGWVPDLKINITDVVSSLRFGAPVLLNNVINYLSASVDVLIGARLLSANELGVYSLPRNFVVQVQGVIGPILSRVIHPLIAATRNDNKKTADKFLKANRIWIVISAALYSQIALAGPLLIGQVLDTRWSAAAALLPGIAAWGFLRSTFGPLGGLLLGTGKPWRAVVWNIFQMVAVLPSCLIGSMYGPDGLVYGGICALAILYIPAWQYIAHSATKVSFRSYVAVAITPALFSFGGAYIIKCIYLKMGYAIESWLSVLLLSIGALVLYSVLCILWIKLCRGAFSAFDG